MTSLNVLITAASRRVPLASEPRYLDTLLDICAQERIGRLAPTTDDELARIAGARGMFEVRGVQVAVSPRRTTEIRNDKKTTCDFVKPRSGARPVHRRSLNHQPRIIALPR